MNTVFNEKSCGAIVFSGFQDKYKILLINFVYGDLNMWGFPKGHVEAGETEIQTAEREIKEETGLDVKISSNFRASTKFPCQKDVISEVIYYAAKADEIDISPQNKDDSEIVINSKWCKFDEAKNLLTFDCDKEILNQFAEFLKDDKNKEVS